MFCHVPGFIGSIYLCTCIPFSNAASCLSLKIINWHNSGGSIFHFYITNIIYSECTATCLVLVAQCVQVLEPHSVTVLNA